ncbi:MAG TPA: MSMEG_0565 family glycosyltransferase [Polyangiaceae bacterium]|jgi:glycosyltransferase-like protein|nr:MSMEG_0565 family glycosyltransferase [Polyangiaceae bacterium]
MKPSIGIFTYSVKPRGSVVHAACLAEALQDEGANVTLYALAKNGDEFYRSLRCPLVLLPAAAAKAGSAELVQQRIAELQAGLATRAVHHDVYHAEDCLTASALVTAVPALSPVARTVHHVERFQTPYLAECQRRSIERSDLLFSVSERTAREVASEFGRSSQLVHNGVNLGRFEQTSAVLPPLASELGLRPDDVLVLSVGGVEERKNTLRALEAMSGALAGDRRLFWVVAGGASIWDHSELERHFDARVASLPETVRRRIVRVGTVDEATLTWLYRRSDLLLCPSLHEGWGLCALEALAAGTVVVASNREPFTEFLDFGVACLVEPTSTVSIQGAVLALAADAPRRAKLGAAGRERAQRFSWRRAAVAHLEAYASLRPEARPLSAPARAQSARSVALSPESHDA